MKGHTKCQGLKEGTINCPRKMGQIYKEMTFETKCEGREEGCHSTEIERALCNRQGSLRILPDQKGYWGVWVEVIQET